MSQVLKILFMNKGFLIALFLMQSLANANYDKQKYGDQKIGNPYKIGKKQYTPRYYNSFNEEGYISWYGPGFHAKKTANGAKFDKHTYTVAHKTLQMPAVIEITNLENGKKLIAVVNDRGPFSETQHRILDVSERIAKDLEFFAQGVTRGRIRLLPKETKDLIAGKKVYLGLVGNKSQKNSPYTKISENLEEENVSRETLAQNFNGEQTYIQVGAFQSLENLQNTIKTLESEAIENIVTKKHTTEDGTVLEIVRIGPLKKGLEEETLNQVKSLGYYNAKILTLK